MDEYRQKGALPGWLLVPETATSYIFRAGEASCETIVSFGQALPGEAVLPGSQLNLRVLR